MDLISMVQQARIQHDETAQPSQIAAVYWIEAKSAAPDSPPPTPRAGQWVLDTDVNQVDALWAKIKAATQAGELGYKAKVSTASRSGKPGESRTICVLTYDRADEADVNRVRAALAKLDTGDDWVYER